MAKRTQKKRGTGGILPGVIGAGAGTGSAWLMRKYILPQVPPIGNFVDQILPYAPSALLTITGGIMAWKSKNRAIADVGIGLVFAGLADATFTAMQSTISDGQETQVPDNNILASNAKTAMDAQRNMGEKSSANPFANIAALENYQLI